MNNIVKYSQYDPINEKLWDDIKYGLSKLGRYKAGGKIIGKGKVTKEAQAEIEDLLKKASNSTLKNLKNAIKDTSPEFPNDRSPEVFLKGIEMIAATYDSIKAATKKSKEEEGYLDPLAANELIEGLRKMVKKYADVDLNFIYTTFESKEYNELNEIFGIGKAIKKGASKLKAAKDKAMDKAFGERDTRKNVETIRGGKRGLESNRLPIILSALGASLGAAGWMAQTDWFKDMVTTVEDLPPKEVTETIEETVEKNIIYDENGLSFTIQNNLPSEMDIKLGPNNSIENLKTAINYYGDGDQKKGIEFISQFIDPQQRAASVSNLTQQLSDPANKTVGDIFNKAEGTWGTRGGLFSQYGGAKAAIASFVSKRIAKKLISSGGKIVTTSTVGGALMTLSPILLGVGISLIGAGALLKLMREKGLRQSRFATLNTLLQNLELIPVKDQIEDDKDKDSDLTEKSVYPIMVKNLTALRDILINYKYISIEGEKSNTPDDITALGLDNRAKNKLKNKQKEDKIKQKKFAEGFIYDFKTFSIIEINKFGKSRKTTIASNETYLVESFKKLKRSIQILEDSKDKGISVDEDFLNSILNSGGKTDEERLKDRKSAKDPIKKLFEEIKEHLYGKYSKTMAEPDKLYKESIQSLNDNTKVVAEKISRFAKRAAQFEGEGFYGGLAVLGDNLEVYNQTLEQIMDYLKNK